MHIDAFYDIDDQLLDLESDPKVVTSFYSYNQANGFSNTKSTLVGLSLNAMYDTRDNINDVRSGRYAFASFKYNPEFIGSDKTSSSLWLEYRDYFKLKKDSYKDILALWSWGNFTTSGDLPYMNLPAIAWDQYGKSGAPYSQGRFRGKNMLFTGLEYRKHLFGIKSNPDFFGMVLFANATTANGERNGIDLFEYVNAGYGLGMRININKKSRTNLGIDYGWGDYGTTGLFLRLNENF